MTIAAGHYAYVADWDGLSIIDVANMAAPTGVGFCETPGPARAVAVAEPYVYVTNDAGGLFILGFRYAPVSASISTAGGRLISSFDQTTYTFAVGIFTDTVSITHTPRFAGDVSPISRLAGINHFFEVSAVYSSTGQPAQPTRPYTVTVQYTEAEKGPAVEGTLGLYSWDGARWVAELDEDEGEARPCNGLC
ncbi:MAG: hypothetical protein ACE5LU_22955 [Anaerolineae bacterium]